MLKWIVMGVLTFCLMSAIVPPEQAFSQEAGSFTFIDQQGSPDKPIPVWYYQPPNLPANALIVFVMTGFERNARDYRDGWIQYAKQFNFLLIVPEFSKRDYPTNYQYNDGNMINQKTGQLIPENQWTFSAIEFLSGVRQQIE